MILCYASGITWQTWISLHRSFFLNCKCNRTVVYIQISVENIQADHTFIIHITLPNCIIFLVRLMKGHFPARYVYLELFSLIKTSANKKWTKVLYGITVRVWRSKSVRAQRKQEKPANFSVKIILSKMTNHHKVHLDIMCNAFNISSRFQTQIQAKRIGVEKKTLFMSRCERNNYFDGSFVSRLYEIRAKHCLLISFSLFFDREPKCCVCCYSVLLLISIRVCSADLRKDWKCICFVQIVKNKTQQKPAMKAYANK